MHFGAMTKIIVIFLRLPLIPLIFTTLFANLEGPLFEKPTPVLLIFVTDSGRAMSTL